MPMVLFVYQLLSSVSELASLVIKLLINITEIIKGKHPDLNAPLYKHCFRANSHNDANDDHQPLPSLIFNDVACSLTGGLAIAIVGIVCVTRFIDCVMRFAVAG